MILDGSYTYVDAGKIASGVSTVGRNVDSVFGALPSSGVDRELKPHDIALGIQAQGGFKQHFNVR